MELLYICYCVICEKPVFSPHPPTVLLRSEWCDLLLLSSVLYFSFILIIMHICTFIVGLFYWFFFFEQSVPERSDMSCGILMWLTNLWIYIKQWNPILRLISQHGQKCLCKRQPVLQLECLTVLTVAHKSEQAIGCLYIKKHIPLQHTYPTTYAYPKVLCVECVKLCVCVPAVALSTNCQLGTALKNSHTLHEPLLSGCVLDFQTAVLTLSRLVYCVYSLPCITKKQQLNLINVQPYSINKPSKHTNCVKSP